MVQYLLLLLLATKQVWRREQGTHFYGKTAQLEIVWVAKPFVPGT
jgi:hypothetical protein